MKLELSPEDVAPRILNVMNVNAQRNHLLILSSMMMSHITHTRTARIEPREKPRLLTRAAMPSGLPTDLGAREMMHSPCVKLPNLSLKRFNGDLTKWTTFWDTFKSAVHDNLTLTSIDKFNYLNSLLESAAVEAIAGLTLTSANYEEAIATLKQRFG